MSTKRAFVPTALHTELTEYTNLVRVLRTARTLDLTTHLLQHAAQHGGEEKGNDTDTWTRWPLIDCPVPEWSLEDEIQRLGESALRQLAPAPCAEADGEQTAAHPDGFGLDSDPDLEALPPAVANSLVLHTGSVLVHILNLMADQRPSAPGSMQNRLWPMNWEDVISLLAVGGAVDPTVVARVEKRLERIYGPSTTKAVERLKSVVAANARFSKLASDQEDLLFAPPVLYRTRRKRTKGRRSHKSGAKSRAVIDTDTDVEV